MPVDFSMASYCMSVQYASLAVLRNNYRCHADVWQAEVCLLWMIWEEAEVYLMYCCRHQI